MMKNSILSTCILLMIFLVGCDQPSGSSGKRPWFPSGGGGNGGGSEGTALSAPTNVSGYYSYGEIYLSWNEVADATSYEIWQADTANINSAMPLSGTTDPDGAIISGTFGGTEYFWVKAKKGSATSDFSDMVTVEITIESTYSIGDTGPGGGLIFFIDGNTHYECSNNLGTATWNGAKILAENYRGGNYDDWYLPNKDELNYIYKNLRVPNHITDNNRFWSSSSSSTDYYKAWYHNFDNGFQYDFGDKTDSFFAVRAVRTLIF